MTDDELPELPEGLMSRAEEMEDDDSIDFESKQRQDDGWIRQYIECPDCGVPMARTTLESDNVELPMAHSASESIHRAICPQCHKIGARVLIRTVTAEYDDLDAAFDDDLDPESAED